MSDLDGPDPVQAMMDRGLFGEKDNEYKERVKLLEEQMALASVIVLVIILPTKCCEEHLKKQAKALTHDATHFIKKATEYIKKYPKAAKDS